MDVIKKVLYISYDGLTDPLGQSQILPYLVHLSKYGYEFTILSFEKKARFEAESGIIESIIKKHGIRWVPLSFTPKPPILSKIWDRYQMWRTASSLFKENRYDIIHCRSYIAAEVGLKLKRKYGIKFLFDMRGFWADEKVDNGQWDLKNPLFKTIYKKYKNKEKEFLKEADGIISLTTAAKVHLLEQGNYRMLDIDVIPCCADLDHFDFNKVDFQQQSALKTQLGIQEKDQILTYLGSIGGWYMTKEMFGFFKQLKAQHPDFKMLILTKDDPSHVQAEAHSFGISSEDIIVTYADRKSLPVYLSLSTCSIFFIRNTFSKKASSPTKHAELMGMGIPVICNVIGDLGMIIEDTRTGLIIHEFTDLAYQQAIKEMGALLSMRKQDIRDASFHYFDLQDGVSKYLSVYKRLFNT